ncbi:hypothetical protein Save01_02198 [Streptomyces avermitilis]|uniref:Uncharacterized protein n=1 Tax=Streptomyces avermitilis TaxID=33903 RepID=A0A4D4MRZ4_STRAX|nr:hypothetical protein SAVMC3_58790 [Streptomyces avermitilis]GDY74526.1 hypothetical protein SAV31267_040110 [Streptomyces avermitilis]GDY83574.1 hypothetical protein SAVCW2_27730 [Streptomyces avermitilis]
MIRLADPARAAQVTTYPLVIGVASGAEAGTGVIAGLRSVL